MTVGERLRVLRLANGLTQEEVASALNTSKQTVYKYETGVITNIPMDKITKLAELFGTEPGLITGWDVKSPQVDDMEKALRRLGVLRGDGTIDLDKIETLVTILKISQNLNTDN